MSSRRLRGALLRGIGFVVLALVFDFAHGQWPLYTSNQNTYLLHGIARAGFGHLREDWLARTADPTPVFSILVTIVFRLLSPSAFYLVHAALAGVYVLSIAGIVHAVFARTRLRHGAFVAFLVVLILDSAWAGRVGPQVHHASVFAYAGRGVAHQLALGPVLQPSAFGVFLLLSICAFLRDHPRRAAFYASVAATFHPTYTLAAITLDVAYALAITRHERRVGKAAEVAGVGALSLAPIVAYVGLTFRPTSAVAFARAQLVLVTRLALHATPAKWISAIAWCQIGAVVLALILLRKTRLFVVLLVPAVVGAALTLCDVVWPSPTLALLFPWRVSIFLVPIACAILVAGPLASLMRHPRGAFVVGAALVCAAVLAVVDGREAAGRLVDGRRMSDGREAAGRLGDGASELGEAEPQRVAVYDWIRAHAAPGDVYVAPLLLDTFRLATGAPEVVDYKSHPYRDVEVYAWTRRLANVLHFYSSGDCAALGRLADAYGATHVLLDVGGADFSCGGAEVYADARHRVVRIARRGARPR